MPRFFKYCLIILLGLLASACQGELGLEVDVYEDGSGLVALTLAVDDDFVDTFGSLKDATVDDLVAAGWAIEISASSEGELLRLEKPFAKMEDLADVIAEIDGPEGLFRSVTLDRIDERDSVRYEFAMEVDLTRRILDLSDSELTSALDGRPLGFEPRDLTAMAGGTLESALLVNVHVNLVGEEIDFSDSLDAAEVFPLSLETTITDQGALDLRDEARDKRDTAAVLGIVFLVGTFAFWLFMRLRYTYVYEGEYGYEDGEEYAQQQYAPAQPVPAHGAAAQAAVDPGPNHVWSDGEGWILASEPQTPPEPADTGEENSAFAPSPPADEIVVSGGSVDMTGDENSDTDDTPQAP